MAVHLGLPETTLRTWLGLARSPAVVTYLGDKTHPLVASVPFIGLRHDRALKAIIDKPSPRRRPSLRARVSTVGQDKALQLDALQKVDVDRIFTAVSQGPPATAGSCRTARWSSFAEPTGSRRKSANPWKRGPR